MPIESDVLVIGGGLAGLTCAASAAQTGADVRLVSYKQSTLRNASGLVDILGYTPAGEGPIANPYEAISSLPSTHPYRTVGEATIREAMDLFDSLTPEYHGSHTDRNALLPTHGGTLKPTARYPDGASAGVASDNRDVLLVGFESLVDFDAEHAASHLEAADVPFRVRGVNIPFPGDLRADAKVTRYAKLLDGNSTVSVRGSGRPVRDALAQRVNRELDGEPRVGFPAVLGNENARTVRAELGEKLRAVVFEVPMGPPSLPGLRLEESFFSALDVAGVSIETGNPVTEYEGEKQIERVYIDKNGARIPNSADQYVLATGGLVGKGLNSTREQVFEPIFDCYVPSSEDRYEWFESGVFDDHSFARFGVRTDDDLRPLDEEKVVEFENLRAAGSVLGGYDFAAEKSGSGVSIATGYAAGKSAGMEAQ